MICLKIPAQAIPLNNAYYTIKLPKGTKRVMTQEGKKFKREAVAHLAKQYALVLSLMKPNKQYAVYFRFTMPKVENATWAAGGCSSRFIGQDTSNLFKLTEDALVEATAVDDSHFLAIGGKRVVGSPPKVEIFIWDVEKEGSPLDELDKCLPVL